MTQDIPHGLAVYIEGTTFPDAERQNEVGLSGLRSCPEYVAVGPDGACGWILSQKGVANPDAPRDWLKVGQVWVSLAVPQGTKTGDKRSGNPVKRRRKKPSRIIAAIRSQIEQELMDEINGYVFRSYTKKEATTSKKTSSQPPSSQPASH